MQTILKSSHDASVNFIESKSIGFLESRYVRRTDDYAIVYLSSQSGCNQSCRMCHLTATKQVDYENATVGDYISQAESVFEYYKTQKPVPLIHYNYMARGEPLDNQEFITEAGVIIPKLDVLASVYGVDKTKHLVSTILPTSMGSKTLTQIFGISRPEIYYSLYSVKPEFRKRWLGKAHSAEHGLDLLVDWQQQTGKTPKIHFAFIENENDSIEDVTAMCKAINDRDLKVNFNIVRYNPHSDKYGKEPDETVINRNVDIMVDMLKPERYRIVPRVGFDVKASCGMFIVPQLISK